MIGVPPMRIGIITSISGVSFADAWPRRRNASCEDVTAHFIGKDELIRNKRAVGSSRDLDDIRILEGNKGE
jgi:hypothetical protein